MRPLYIAFLFTALSVLASCNPPPPPLPPVVMCAVTGVTVSGASSVNRGETTPLSAVVNAGPQGCVGTVSQTVTWTSSDPSKATVSASGVVTGVQASSTPVSITATSSVDTRKQGSQDVTVTATVWQQVSSGGGHTCGVSSGSVYCWGSGYLGQLGNGATTDSSTPKRVSDVAGVFTNSGVTTVSSGGNHTCAVSSGSVYCWGIGSGGRLGNGATTDSSTAVRVSNVAGVFTNSGVTTVSSGNANTCVVSSGSVYCWGLGVSGQLGNGATTDSSTAVRVSDVAGVFTNIGVTAVSSSGQHTCGVSSGSLYCWGLGVYGRLGNGATTSSLTAVRVSEPTP